MEFYMKLPRSKKEFALFMGCLLYTSGCAHRPAVDLAERHRRCPIDLHPRRKDDGKNCFERRQF